MQGLPPPLQKRFRPLAGGGGGGVRGLACTAETPLLQSVLRYAPDAGLRRAAWEACHRQPAANLAVLDRLVEVGGCGECVCVWCASCSCAVPATLCVKSCVGLFGCRGGGSGSAPCHPPPSHAPGLLQARSEIAGLMGYPSYAQYQLDSFSLASRPAAVAAFLVRFAAAIGPKCRQEVDELARLKAAGASGGGSGPAGGAAEAGAVQPWDRQHLMAAAQGGADAAALARLPEWFELERVIEGLGELLARSMGVRLEERPLAPGGRHGCG